MIYSIVCIRLQLAYSLIFIIYSFQNILIINIHAITVLTYLLKILNLYCSLVI
jgi:hypothetical protein